MFPPLLTLEAKISGSLEGEVASVALYEKAVFLTADEEFHPIAAFYLKGRIVGSGGMMMVMITGAAVMVPGNICAFCNQCGRYGQPWRLVVLAPLAHAFYEEGDEYTEDQHKTKDEQNTKDIEHLKSLLKSHSKAVSHGTILPNHI